MKKITAFFTLLFLLFPTFINTTNASINLEGSKEVIGTNGASAGVQRISGNYDPNGGKVNITVVNEIEGSEAQDPEGIVGEMALEKCDGTVTCKVVDFNKDGYKDLFIVKKEETRGKNGSRQTFGQKLTTELYIYIPRIQKILKVDTLVNESGKYRGALNRFNNLMIDLNAGTPTSATMAIEYKTCVKYDGGRCEKQSDWKMTQEKILDPDTLKLIDFTGGISGTLVKKINYNGQICSVFYTTASDYTSDGDRRRDNYTYKIKCGTREYRLGESRKRTDRRDNENRSRNYFLFLTKSDLGDVLYNNIKNKLGGKEFFIYFTGQEGMSIAYIDESTHTIKIYHPENNLRPRNLDRDYYNRAPTLNIDKENGILLFYVPWYRISEGNDGYRASNSATAFFIGLTKNTTFSGDKFTHIDLERKAPLTRDNRDVRGQRFFKTTDKNGNILISYYDGMDYFVVKIDKNTGVWSGENKIIREYGTDYRDGEDNCTSLKDSENVLIFNRFNCGHDNDASNKNVTIITSKITNTSQIFHDNEGGPKDDRTMFAISKDYEYLNDNLLVGMARYSDANRQSIKRVSVLFNTNNNYTGFNQRKWNAAKDFWYRSYRDGDVRKYYNTSRHDRRGPNLQTSFIYSKATGNLYLYNVEYTPFNSERQNCRGESLDKKCFWGNRRLFVYTPKAGGGYEEHIYNTKWKPGYSAGNIKNKILETENGEYKLNWEGAATEGLGFNSTNGIVEKAELTPTDNKTILLENTYPTDKFYLYGNNGNYNNINKIELVKEKTKDKFEIKTVVIQKEFDNPLEENTKIIKTDLYGYLSVKEVEINGIKVLEVGDINPYKTSKILKDLGGGKLALKKENEFEIIPENYSGTMKACWQTSSSRSRDRYWYSSCKNIEKRKPKGKELISIDSNFSIFLQKMEGAQIGDTYKVRENGRSKFTAPRLISENKTFTYNYYFVKPSNSDLYVYYDINKVPSIAPFDLYYDKVKKSAVNKSKLISDFENIKEYNNGDYLVYENKLYYKLGDKKYKDSGETIGNSIKYLNIDGNKKLFVIGKIIDVTSEVLKDINGTKYYIVNNKYVFSEDKNTFYYRYFVVNNEITYPDYNSTSILFKNIRDNNVEKEIKGSTDLYLQTLGIDLNGIKNHCQDERRRSRIPGNANFHLENSTSENIVESTIYKYTSNQKRPCRYNYRGFGTRTKIIFDRSNLDNIKIYKNEKYEGVYNEQKIFNALKDISSFIKKENGKINIEKGDKKYDVNISKLLNGNVTDILTEITDYNISYLYQDGNISVKKSGNTSFEANGSWVRERLYTSNRRDISGPSKPGGAWDCPTSVSRCRRYKNGDENIEESDTTVLNPLEFEINGIKKNTFFRVNTPYERKRKKSDHTITSINPELTQKYSELEADYKGREGKFYIFEIKDKKGNRITYYVDPNDKAYEYIGKTNSNGFTIYRFKDNGNNLIKFQKGDKVFTYNDPYITSANVIKTNNYYILDARDNSNNYHKYTILNLNLDLLATKVYSESFSFSDFNLGNALYGENSHYYFIGKDLTYNIDNKSNVYLDPDHKIYISKDRGLYLPLNNTYDGDLKYKGLDGNITLNQYNTGEYKAIHLTGLGGLIINPNSFERVLLDKSLFSNTSNVYLIFDQNLESSLFIVNNSDLNRTFIVNGKGVVKNLYDGQFSLNGKKVKLGGKIYYMAYKGGIPYILDTEKSKVLLLELYLHPEDFNGQELHSRGKIVKLETDGANKNIYVDGNKVYTTNSIPLTIVKDFRTSNDELIFYSNDKNNKYYYLDVNSTLKDYSL